MHGCPERIGCRRRRRSARELRGGIEVNQVHVCVDSVEQRHEPFGVFDRVVHTVDQCPAEKHAAARRVGVVATCLDDIRQRPARTDRNKTTTFVFRASVQADAEVIRPTFVGHTADAGDNAHRVHRDARRPDGESV